MKELFRKVITKLVFNYRLLNTKNRMDPSFFIVGAQKAGTTSLYRYLVQHPKVKSALIKEIHYFDLNNNKSLTWYKSFFPLKQEGYITGEASPYYMYHPLAIKRIANYNPDAKIILLLRDPVSRAISHYYHEVRNGREELNIKDAFEAEEARLKGEIERIKTNQNSFNHQRYSYRSRGLYLEQIKEIRKYFDDENIMIIDSEEFFKKTEYTVRQVFKFIGVSNDVKLKTQKRFNVGNNIKDPYEDKLIEELKVFYKEANLNLFDVIGRKGNWK